MSNAVMPVIGQWYRHVEKAETFQVIEVENGDGAVEVQFFDGDIEAIPRDEWRALPIEECAPPEDPTGPYDDIERDDAGHPQLEVHYAEEQAEALQEAQLEPG